MITTAWYDITSRLQSNHVILQRRHDQPKSWLHKQRQLVNSILSLIRALLSLAAVATTLKNLYRISIVLQQRKPNSSRPSPSIRRLMTTMAAATAFVSVLVTGVGVID
ncbi:hypothetical protein QBC45DRAFT_178358 [Copromyces sp. CBS 386.78]|nr:hypothetical protein QBC45DRAFT_178358 [Copromyces sp. CBS 386.78]